MYISLLHSQFCSHMDRMFLSSRNSHSSSLPAVTVEDTAISVELFGQLQLMVVHQLVIYYYY